MATDGSSMEQITNKLMERQNLKRGDRGAVQNPGGPAHPRGRRGLGVRRHLRRLMPGQSPHVRSWWSSPPPVLACFCSPSHAICIRAVAWLPVVVRQQRGPLSVGCARYQILVCLCVLGRAGHPRPQTLVARFDVVRVLADGDFHPGMGDHSSTVCVVSPPPCGRQMPAEGSTRDPVAEPARPKRPNRPFLLVARQTSPSRCRRRPKPDRQCHFLPQASATPQRTRPDHA